MDFGQEDIDRVDQASKIGTTAFVADPDGNNIEAVFHDRKEAE